MGKQHTEWYDRPVDAAKEPMLRGDWDYSELTGLDADDEEVGS